MNLSTVIKRKWKRPTKAAIIITVLLAFLLSTLTTIAFTYTQLTTAEAAVEKQTKRVAELTTQTTSQQEQIEELTSKVAELTKTNEDLNKKLSTKTASTQTSQKASTQLSSRSGTDVARTVVQSDDFLNGATKTTMRVTYYNGPTDTTASGAKVQSWHTIAMGKAYPFGTRVYIPAFKDMPNGGIFVCQDRGGAVHNGVIDIYLNESTASLYKRGTQNLEVYILK